MLYRLAVTLRNARYDRGVGVGPHPGVPVISVGNLTTGGTGKTPLVIEIGRRLRDSGGKPAILTRGYGGSRDAPADEVLELRAALPDVPVVVNADRLAGAREAIERHGADVLILDDGFQHRRMPRDLDIVLIDALDPWGGGRLLPAGRLREPRESLERADVVVLTRSNQVPPAVADHIVAEIQALNDRAAVVRAGVEPAGLRSLDEQPRPLSELAYRCVMPVSGIGNPESFERLLYDRVGRLVEPLRYRDHHRYRPADITRIVRAARLRDADTVVTTRKDWPKLAPLWRAAEVSEPELLRLEVRTVLEERGVGLWEVVAKACAQLSKADATTRMVSPWAVSGEDEDAEPTHGPAANR